MTWSETQTAGTGAHCSKGILDVEEFSLSERTNEQWVTELEVPGEDRESALTDLRGIILRGLPYALSKWMRPTDPQFSALSEEVAQETLLRVLDNLHTFEGRSKFTTWVHKIAVRIALTELRRKRWRDVSLDELTEKVPSESSLSLLADPETGPDQLAEQQDMIEQLQRVIQEELTEKQGTALVATQIQGIPIEEVARRMGTNRNALYKLLHDARQRLKARMEEEGLSAEEILAAFEPG